MIRLKQPFVEKMLVSYEPSDAIRRILSANQINLSAWRKWKVKVIKEDIAQARFKARIDWMMAFLFERFSCRRFFQPIFFDFLLTMDFNIHN